MFVGKIFIIIYEMIKMNKILILFAIDNFVNLPLMISKYDIIN